MNTDTERMRVEAETRLSKNDTRTHTKYHYFELANDAPSKMVQHGIANKLWSLHVTQTGLLRAKGEGFSKMSENSKSAVIRRQRRSGICVEAVRCSMPLFTSLVRKAPFSPSPFTLLYHDSAVLQKIADTNRHLMLRSTRDTAISFTNHVCKIYEFFCFCRTTISIELLQNTGLDLESTLRVGVNAVGRAVCRSEDVIEAKRIMFLV